MKRLQSAILTSKMWYVTFIHESYVYLLTDQRQVVCFTRIKSADDSVRQKESKEGSRKSESWWDILWIMT